MTAFAVQARSIRAAGILVARDRAVVKLALAAATRRKAFELSATPAGKKCTQALLQAAEEHAACAKYLEDATAEMRIITGDGPR